MIEKSHYEGMYVANCDLCPFAIEVEAYSFREAVDAIKDEGWSVFKDKDEWRHKCPSCRMLSVRKSP